MTSKKNTVLLINPNRMQPRVAPVGIDYIGAALKAEGFQPALFDMNLKKSFKKELKAAIEKLAPQAVGISVRNIDDCYYASQAFLLNPVRNLVSYIKRLTDAPVILGGVGYSIAPFAALDYVGGDYGIRGDGERALPELFRALETGRSLSNIPGLHWPGAGKSTIAAADLNALDSASRSLVDLQTYFKTGGQGNIETKRGCNKNCVYCADPVAKGRKIRCRSAESVTDELEALLGRGIDVFHFCDSEFNIPMKHAAAICEEIIKRGLDKKIKWYAYLSPKPFSKGLARLMAAAGCLGIDFGADSGSDMMLETLGRDFSAQDLAKAADNCRVAGITFMYDLLLGGPGETRETLKETISLIKKVRPDQVGVSLGVRVFPSTKLAAMILDQGALAENPNIQGCAADNPHLLKPVFYLAESMGPSPGAYINKLIAGDSSFLFADPDDKERNYNYNDNSVLTQAIKKGARGAYWDILRKIQQNQP